MQGTANTQLVEGAAIAESDEQIVNAIKKAHKRSAGGVSEWRFAIRNEEGTIYRTGSINGLDGMMALADGLERLGFDDELVESDKKVRGYDAIFRKS